MSILLKNTKATVMGIQGSGKTELAKRLTVQFTKPVWYLVHKDDLTNMPRHVAIMMAEKKNLVELNEFIGSCIKLAQQKKIDAIFIDEADMFLNTNIDITRYSHINDVVINHRHYGLAVVFITRRPQDIPTKYIESCEHSFIFALPNSDNVDRKMNALDRHLLELTKQCTKDNHRYVHKKLGYKPTLMEKIQMKGEAPKNDETKKAGNTTHA